MVNFFGTDSELHVKLQENSQEKKIYLDQRKIINSQDDCDKINNAQSQKNCLDTYL